MTRLEAFTVTGSNIRRVDAETALPVTVIDRDELDWRAVPVDLAARDRELARDFAAALKQRQTGTLRIIDLAAGSGSNFRALAPLLAGEVRSPGAVSAMVNAAVASNLVAALRGLNVPLK